MKKLSSSMKIAFNAYFLSGRKAGIGYYTFNILNALRAIDHENEYIDIPNKFDLNKLIFEQLYLPIVLMFKKAGLFFSPSLILPFFTLAPSILVIYDLSFRLFPEYYRGKINLLYLRLFLGHSIAKAKKIIVISENTKRDLVRLYGVPDDKVRVIHLAASAEFAPVKDVEKLKNVKQRYSLPDEFILFVGTIEPRKNVQGLIQAYFALPQALRTSKKLVLCGQKGWGYKHLKLWLDKQSEKDSVVFLDYVSADDLPLLYNLATLFVYPSFYEGFGLPVLEAMACGVPTITSNISSLPEVAGNAALLADPHNVADLSDKISQALLDQDLLARMRQKGRERAAAFSWRAAAEKTLAVFREVEASK